MTRSEREVLIRKAEEDHVCPICGAEMDRIPSGHERDSSNDRTECPTCKWGYGETETWFL